MVNLPTLCQTSLNSIINAPLPLPLIIYHLTGLITEMVPLFSFFSFVVFFFFFFPSFFLSFFFIASFQAAIEFLIGIYNVVSGKSFQ